MTKIIDITLQTFYFVITISMIILVIILFLSKLSNGYTIYESYCKSIGGDYVFYECMNSLVSNCNDLKTGYWCETSYKNISKSEIDKILNSTQIAI